MRQALAQTLTEIAAKDKRVVLLTADLGFMVLEEFATAFPDRFYNVGVAEANMVGIGTGLAEAGYIPFLYSIATFASMRPYEQFRDGPILHHLPVRLIGIGGGFEYGNSGITHYALEDMGIMRLQPNLTTIVPADSQQARNVIRDTYQLPGPIYYRISKNDKLTVPGLNGRFRLGGVEVVKEGTDALIVSIGASSSDAVKAAEKLANAGIHCAVAVVSTLRPEPAEELAAILSRVPLAVTVESHYVTGGLGSLVAEVIAEQGVFCRLVRCGIKSMPSGVSGSEQYMTQAHELSADQIYETVVQTLGVKQLKNRS